MYVKGKIETPLGPMRFQLVNPRVTALGVLWKINEVEYEVSLSATREDTTATSEWKEKAGSVNIQRTDDRGVNYRSKVCTHIRREMLSRWATYATDENTKGVLVLAALAEIKTQFAALLSAERTALRQLCDAHTALHQWYAKREVLINEIERDAKTAQFDTTIALVREE